MKRSKEGNLEIWQDFLSWDAVKNENPGSMAAQVEILNMISSFRFPRFRFCTESYDLRSVIFSLDVHFRTASHELRIAISSLDPRFALEPRSADCDLFARATIRSSHDLRIATFPLESFSAEVDGG